MRGPKPIPTHLKLISGNPGKRRLNDAEPIAPPAIPEAPAHLSARARLEWDRSALLLKDSGLLSNLDRNIFANYCQAWGRLQEAEEGIAKTGMLVKSPSGYVMQSPFLAIINRCMAQIASYGAELGLSPSSRSRIRVTDDKPADTFQEYLAHGPGQTPG